MKQRALLMALVLCLGNAAQAAIIDLVPGAANSAASAASATAPTNRPLPHLAVTDRSGIVLPAPRLSELPEPEVFAMMLVGLILIGYRAARDKSDKFK